MTQFVSSLKPFTTRLGNGALHSWTTSSIVVSRSWADACYLSHMLSKRVLDGDDQGSWLSLRVALSELETMLSSAPEADIAFLKAHHAALKVQIEQANLSLQ
jgi:hypothetical protein